MIDHLILGMLAWCGVSVAFGAVFHLWITRGRRSWDDWERWVSGPAEHERARRASAPHPMRRQKR